MSHSSSGLVQEFFQDFSKKLPIHELEILLESAFHREFPLLDRLDRQQLYSGEFLPGSSWVTQARLWAEKRLLSGVPIQHLTREQCFFGRYFEVGPEVLIPRPETEILVAHVLQWLSRQQGVDVFWGAEIGTGSGIIPLTLALESGCRVKMTATELSEDALRCAQRNADRFQGSRDAIEWISIRSDQDVLDSLQLVVKQRHRPFDFLVSNPPYLINTPDEVDPDVERFEPAGALFAPVADALFYYREIASHAHRVVRPGGRVFLEIPHERQKEIQSLFQEFFEEVRIFSDLAGKSRVLEAN